MEHPFAAWRDPVTSWRIRRAGVPGRAFAQELTFRHPLGPLAPRLMTGYAADVRWRVELPGRAPLTFEAGLRVPYWVRPGAPTGRVMSPWKREGDWGLLPELGLPCRATDDPPRVAVDWRAALFEHMEAWRAQGR